MQLLSRPTHRPPGGGCAGFEWVEIQPGPTTLVFQFLPDSWVVCRIGNIEEPVRLWPRSFDSLNCVCEDVHAVRVNGKQVSGA